MKSTTATICLLIPLTAFLLILPPNASATGWNIQVTNGPDTSTTVTYDQLLSLPQTTVYAELYCYGNLVTSGNWTGVRLTDFLTYVCLDPSGGSIDFVAQDGYHVSIPVSMATQPNVIIAYQKDGMPLSETYRLVIPGSNGNLWISMITSLGPGAETDAISQSPNSLPVSGNSIVPRQAQTQLQPAATPSPTPPQTPVPSNTTAVQSIAPNLTASQTSGVQGLPKAGAGFPIEIFYILALVVLTAVVLGSFAVIRRRKRVV